MRLYTAEWDFKGDSKLILDYLFRIKPLGEIFSERERIHSIRANSYENGTIADASTILALNPMENEKKRLLILTSRTLFVHYPFPLGTFVVGWSDKFYRNCIVSNSRSFYWLHFKASPTLRESLQKLLQQSPSTYEIWDIANAAEELAHLLGLGEHHTTEFFKDNICLMRGYKENMEKIQKVEDLHFCQDCYRKLESQQN